VTFQKSSLNLSIKTALVLFVVASVGCGKSKTEKNPAPVVTGTETTPQGGGGRGQGRTPAPNQGTPGVNTPGQQVGAPSPAAPPPQIGSGGGRTQPGRGQPSPGRGNQPGRGEQPGRPAPGTGAATDPNNENESGEVFGAGTIKFDETEALKTGGQKITAAKSATPYFYTGASKDGVLERLKDMQLGRSEAEKSLNAAIASWVQHARLGKARDGQTTLSLEIQHLNDTKQVIRLKTESESSTTLIVSKTNRPISQDSLQPVGGELICMDLNKSSETKEKCSVRVAKINFTTGYIYIIFRKTSAIADANFNISDRDYAKNDNTAFARLMKYVSNRVQHVKTTEKIRDLYLSSFEVVGGESELGVILTTEDKQMATFRIPLVAEAQGVSVDARVAQDLDLANYFDIADIKDSFSRTLLAGIDSVRLINNNGRGDVRMRLKFEKMDSAAKSVDQSTLELTLARSEAVVDLQKLESLR